MVKNFDWIEDYLKDLPVSFFYALLVNMLVAILLKNFDEETSVDIAFRSSKIYVDLCFFWLGIKFFYKLIKFIDYERNN